MRSSRPYRDADDIAQIKTLMQKTWMPTAQWHIGDLSLTALAYMVMQICHRSHGQDVAIQRNISLKRYPAQSPRRLNAYSPPRADD